MIDEADALYILKKAARSFSAPVPEAELRRWSARLVDHDVRDLEEAARDLPKKVPHLSLKALSDAIHEANRKRLMLEQEQYVRGRVDHVTPSPVPPAAGQRLSEQDSLRYGTAGMVLQAALRARMRDPVTGAPLHEAFWSHGIKDDPEAIDRLYRRVLALDEQALLQWRDRAEVLIVALNAETGARFKLKARLI